MDMRVDVYHHIDQTGASSSDAKLDQALSLLTSMEAQMSALSDAVDALQARIDEDVTHLQQLVTDANQRAADAAANDAADAATIADLQAQIDASNADAAAVVARLQAIDPVADFPGVPPDPGTDPNPPVDTTVDPGNPSQAPTGDEPQVNPLQ